MSKHIPGKHTGFTLIELMIVIAIIGILAAVAFPQYQQITNRVFVTSEALSAARPFQQAVNEYYLQWQSLPAGAGSLGLASLTGNSSKVQSVSVATDGSALLTVLFKDDSKIPVKIKGLTMVLKPVINSPSDTVSWTVDVPTSTLPEAYLPML